MADTAIARGWSPGKTTAVVVLTIIAILAIVAGVLYFTEPARSLPSFLGAITSPAAKAAAHRSKRGIAALVIGVVFLLAAGITTRLGRSAR